MAEITNFYEQKPLSGGAPKQIVLLLHGLGSNGQDLISLAPLWAESVPDAVFISPDAPFPCDMAPVGHQWFSLQNRDPQTVLSGVQAANPILAAFITAQLARYNLSADKLVLAGFSQGTMMSLYTAPRYKEGLAGILGYSGALVWEPDLKAGTLQKMPVHLIHGEADEVVPVSAYHTARAALEAYGFTVSGHTTPNLPHSIDQAGIESGAAFLDRIF